MCTKVMLECLKETSFWDLNFSMTRYFIVKFMLKHFDARGHMLTSMPVYSV